MNADTNKALIRCRVHITQEQETVLKSQIIRSAFSLLIRVKCIVYVFFTVSIEWFYYYSLLFSSIFLFFSWSQEIYNCKGASDPRYYVRRAGQVEQDRLNILNFTIMHTWSCLWSLEIHQSKDFNTYLLWPR